ncbi:MAG TPA: carboxypeptidase-like regulatory domain-containing protein, partial [Blastocatellia bacterium]|nr:carboxypeptidase-like regulatory domain-containing protein [Blastocatellia bacterium]
TKDQKNIGAYGWGPDLTEANGEFVLRGLSPGRYAAFVMSKEYYGDPTIFEVTNSDVEGIEVKAFRGASISGIAVIEGANAPAVQNLLPRVTINANMFSTTMQMPASSTQVLPDGSFRLSALRPGKARLSTSTSDNSPLQLVRIERDGVPLGDGVELTAGEQVRGVKIVLMYGAGAIRGQVKVVGGTLTPDTRLVVWANHSGAGAGRSAQVDVRGNFVLDNLAPGEYRLSVSQPVVAGTSMVHRAPVVLQTVTVGAGETAVTLTLDVSKQKEGQQ